MARGCAWAQGAAHNQNVFAPEDKLTSKDRRDAERQVEVLRDSGDQDALGRAYLKLAGIYMKIGAGEGEHPFPASASAAEIAVQLLTGSADRKAYAKALRASVVAFTTDSLPEAKSRLEEALAISTELGDAREIGWSHKALWGHAMRTGDQKSAEMHDRLKFDVWMASGEDELVADALFTDALQHDRGWEQYEEAGKRYEAAKGWRSAATAYNLAAMGASEELRDKAVIRGLARRLILCAQKWGDKTQIRTGKNILRRNR